MASLDPTNRPGQPQPTDIGVDYICLEWESAERDDVTHYEIRMKLASDESWNKTIIPTEDRRPLHRVDDLLQNTGYEFMLRAVYPDGSSSAFSHKSVKITTKCSELRTLLKVCQKIDDGPPGVYRLPLMSVSENKDKKTRKCVFGTSTCLRERTILMVGTNEAGKTTLIEGLVNHCLGVQWEDDFRFAITDETSTHKGPRTEWITGYKLHPIMEKGDFILNIIDTPSFHDGSGSIESNKRVLQRLHWFLSTKDPQGINRGIHAVCFVTPANHVQYDGIDNHLRDIFRSIMSICGVNMLENVIPMLPFADGKSPSVLANLSAAGVPTHHHFVFNNSTLFPPYLTDAQLGKTFWQLGSRGNEEFLKYLSNMNPYRVLENTPETVEPTEKPVIQEENMQLNRMKINDRLEYLSTLKADRDILKKAMLNANMPSTPSHMRVPTEDGKRATNCSHCKVACHYPCTCSVTSDSDLRNCIVFKQTEKCTKCINECCYSNHDTSTKDRYEWCCIALPEFGFNCDEKVANDAMKFAMKRAFLSSLEEVTSLIAIQKKFSKDLQGIQKSEHDFIVHMIDTEKQEKTPGFKKRVELLSSIQEISAVSTSDPSTSLHKMGFVD
ncbi:uncharacterized protein LOC117320948 [Pecten maximus]|uniref:uncharacterized protein LOC117320948 n=1 Tax=Pecten maximus TaxID=6579 RepID=UPI0014584DE1|nr:uncharacterized protein LOC117320948 [Pecten maximus]